MTASAHPARPVTVRRPPGPASYEHLTPADVQALCGALRVPTPTPDVPLEHCARSAGFPSAEDVFAALSGSTDVRVMIAAAALRGITILPRDPRLSPAPLPPCGPPRPPLASGEIVPHPTYTSPVRAPRGAPATAPAGAGAPPWTLPGARVASVAPNPKKAGTASHARYALYRVGLTAAELRELGLSPADLRWDGERGHVTWSAE